MQYSLLIYRSEAELAKMDPDARQKASADYGAFTQSIFNDASPMLCSGTAGIWTAVLSRSVSGVRTSDGGLLPCKLLEVDHAGGFSRMESRFDSSD